MKMKAVEDKLAKYNVEQLGEMPSKGKTAP
jgi:hypothetical protein